MQSYIIELVDENGIVNKWYHKSKMDGIVETHMHFMANEFTTREEAEKESQLYGKPYKVVSLIRQCD